MIIVATFFVLAAWLAFVWIVDPDDFTKRTSKRMARPPFPPRDNKSGGSNVYTVYFGPPGSGRLPHPSGNKWRSKSFVDFPEALLWAHGAAAKGTVIIGIEGAGVDLDRNQVAACLSALSISNRAAHSIGG